MVGIVVRGGPFCICPHIALPWCHLDIQRIFPLYFMMGLLPLMECRTWYFTSDTMGIDKTEETGGLILPSPSVRDLATETIQITASGSKLQASVCSVLQIV